MSASSLSKLDRVFLTKITWSHYFLIIFNPMQIYDEKHTMNYQDINTLNFSALSLNETMSSQSSTVSMFNGWGSEETRRAYTSLDKLANSSSHNHSNHHTNHSNHLNNQAIQYSGSSNSPQIENDESYSFSEDDMDCDNFW